MPSVNALHWCFTSFQIETHPLWNPATMRYLVFQKERCPKTGRLHWQGYVQFKKSMRRKGAQLAIGKPKCRMNPQMGTNDEARNYCMKEPSRVEIFQEFGEFCPGQGVRSDLIDLRNRIKRGSNAISLIEDDDTLGTYARYDRFANQLMLIYQNKEMRLGTTVIWCWGPTGTGKTRSFFEYVQREQIKTWWKAPVCHGQMWFDGYCGQEAVLFDDYSPEKIPLRSLLEILDIYPITVERKNYVIAFKPKVIYVTSSKNPELICDSNHERYEDSLWSQLKRRITLLIHKEADSNVVEIV